jgi:hypothetical protein
MSDVLTIRQNLQKIKDAGLPVSEVERYLKERENLTIEQWNKLYNDYQKTITAKSTYPSIAVERAIETIAPKVKIPPIGIPTAEQMVKKGGKLPETFWTKTFTPKEVLTLTPTEMITGKSLGKIVGEKIHKATEGAIFPTTTGEILGRALAETSIREIAKLPTIIGEEIYKAPEGKISPTTEIILGTVGGTVGDFIDLALDPKNYIIGYGFTKAGKLFMRTALGRALAETSIREIAKLPTNIRAIKVGDRVFNRLKVYEDLVKAVEEARLKPSIPLEEPIKPKIEPKVVEPEEVIPKKPTKPKKVSKVIPEKEISLYKIMKEGRKVITETELENLPDVKSGIRSKENMREYLKIKGIEVTPEERIKSIETIDDLAKETVNSEMPTEVKKSIVIKPRKPRTFKFDPEDLKSVILYEGGIKAYENKIFQTEYNEIVPLFLKNRKGRTLDELADVLATEYPHFGVRDVRSLLEALRDLHRARPSIEAEEAEYIRRDVVNWVSNALKKGEITPEEAKQTLASVDEDVKLVDEWLEWAKNKLDEEAGHISLDDLVDVPVFRRAKSKVLEGIDDTKYYIRNALRIPIWNEHLEEQVKILHRNEQLANRIEDTARRIIKDYLDLSDIEKEKIAKIRWSVEGKRDLTITDLKDRGLTPKEIKGYMSIQNLFNYFHGKPTGKKITTPEGETETISEVKGGLLDFFMRKAGIPEEERTLLLSRSRTPSYIPHYRFGRWWALEKRTWGKGKRILHAEGFESRLEAEEWIKNRPTEITSGKGKKAKVIPVNHEILDSKKFGIDADNIISFWQHTPILSNVLKKQGITDPEIEKLTTILKGEFLKIYARGRLAHRKNVPGYSKDMDRAIDKYIREYPFSIVKRFNRSAVEDVYDKVPTEYKPYAREMIDYFYGEKDYEGRINLASRSFLYAYYLLGKIAFPLVNLTQRGLSYYRGVAEVGTTMSNRIFVNAQSKEISLYRDVIRNIGKGLSLRDIIAKADYLTTAEKRVLQKGFSDGEISALRQKEIFGKGQGLLQKLDVGGFLSERSNRVHSLLMGTQIAQIKGMTKFPQILDYAYDFNYKTQWLYSKANRAWITRGWRAPLTVFKSYVLNHLSYLNDLYGKDKLAFGEAVAQSLALGGILGFYGVGETEKIVDGIMTTPNIPIVNKPNPLYNPQWLKIKHKAKESIDEHTAGVVLHGLPALLKVEGSYAFGSPDFFTIAGLPFGKEVIAIGDLLNQEIDVKQKLKRLSPLAIRSIWNALQPLPHDKKGRAIITQQDINRISPEVRAIAQQLFNRLPGVEDFTMLERVMRGLGFPTVTESKYYEGIQTISELGKTYRDLKRSYHLRIARAIAEEDIAEKDRLIKEARQRGIKLDETAIRQHLLEFRK